MSRSVEWSERSVELQDIKEPIVDHVGMLGPIRAFTLSRRLSEPGYVLTSHFIPSKKRNRVYTDVEAAKRECAKIVSEFARWLAA